MAFIRERTEELDQGSAAFARFETELLERMFAVCRVTLRDYVEARDDRNGPTRQDGQVFYRSAPTRKTINTLRSRSPARGTAPIWDLHPLYRLMTA